MSEARRIADWDADLAEPERATVPMTVSEFRRWADRQSGKWELVDGYPRAMTLPSSAHSLIQIRAGFLIETHLQAIRSPCRAMTEAAVIPTSFRRNNARAADLAITCVPPERDGWEINDPVFILEVLSPSNERDTRDNVWAYMTIPSVRQILLLHSLAIRGEMLERTPGGAWPEEAIPLTPDDTVRIEAIRFACSLSEFYARTALALPPVS